jgi:hypothetical protein
MQKKEILHLYTEEGDVLVNPRTGEKKGKYGTKKYQVNNLGWSEVILPNLPRFFTTVEPVKYVIAEYGDDGLLIKTTEVEVPEEISKQLKEVFGATKQAPKVDLKQENESLRNEIAEIKEMLAGLTVSKPAKVKAPKAEVKEVVEVGDDKDSVVAEYIEVIGKKPHHRKTVDAMKKEIAEAKAK